MSERIYAQVIGDIINLIGGAEVGLPNPCALCIDITDLDNKPNVGDCYVDGVFMTQDEYYNLLENKDDDVEVEEKVPSDLEGMYAPEAVEKANDTSTVENSSESRSNKTQLTQCIQKYIKAMGFYKNQ
ncbi:hypothetical protein [Alkaliphilus peptidifermentans]|uniref:Uncharacterized protein n=1 Tax=Alkaliphilus peptidifermentans DSM 18978 TaxID=1120976 RepID=A0A1G5JWY2_9FIRM|nr:hypothetical protein [Alkaliphilus peptidifermentans]SCY92883.1 hypothetical protein SAMN03080606_03089 [Alkaliphilus peptidifermentans DSM 18978]